jgi:hypothetical protein
MHRKKIPVFLVICCVFLPLGFGASIQASTALYEQQEDCRLAGGTLQPVAEGGFICWFDDGSYIACPSPALDCGYVETQSMIVDDGFLVAQSAASLIPLKEEDDTGESDDFNSGDEEQDRHWCQITQGEYSDWGDYFGDSYDNVYSCSYENGSSFTCIRDSYCFYNTGNDSDQEDTDASSTPDAGFEEACVSGGGAVARWEAGFGCDFGGGTDVVCSTVTDCGPGWIAERWKLNALLTLESGGVNRAIDEDNPAWANMIIGPNSVFGQNDVIGPNSGFVLAEAISIEDTLALMDVIGPNSGIMDVIGPNSGITDVIGPNSGITDIVGPNSIYRMGDYWYANLQVNLGGTTTQILSTMSMGFPPDGFPPDSIVEVVETDIPDEDPISVAMRWQSPGASSNMACSDTWICFPNPISTLGPWLFTLLLLPLGFVALSVILWKRTSLNLLEFARTKPLSLLLSLGVGVGLMLGSWAMFRELHQSGVIQLTRVSSRDRELVGIAYPIFSARESMQETGEGTAYQSQATETPTSTIPMAGNGYPSVPLTGLANCRTGPGTGWSVLLLLQEGSEVEVVGRNVESTWLNVLAMDDQLCWVSSTLVDDGLEIEGLAVVPDPPPPAATATVFLPTATESLGSISGYLYQDMNGDGIRQSGDDGISGVTVLIGAGACPSTGLGSTTSNIHGRYVFDGLAGGIYCITPQIVPTCGLYSIATAPLSGSATVSIGSGEDKFQYFGFKKKIC